MQSFAVGFCPNTSFLGMGRMVLILMGKKPSQIVHYLYLLEQRSFNYLLSFGFIVWAGCGDDYFLLSNSTDSEKTGRRVLEMSLSLDKAIQSVGQMKTK